MTESFDIARLLQLRKVTRAVSERLEKHLRGHLEVLAPLLQPDRALGKYMKDCARSVVAGADQRWARVQEVYGALSRKKPFRMPKELESPLEYPGLVPEITAVEYVHVIEQEGRRETITVTSPLRWVLHYRDFGPARLHELLSSSAPVERDLRRHVVSYLLMRETIEHDAGLGRLLEALRFPVTTDRLDGLGELPVVLLSTPLATTLPPDEVILQSTELSGSPAFHEILEPGDLEDLEDPLKSELLAIAGA